jgi:amidase
VFDDELESRGQLLPDGPDGALIGLAAALAGRRLSSREVVAEALDRIIVTQPTLNAFRRVRHSAALAEADRADRRLAAGERLALLGVPIAVKDDMDIAGEPTAFGCAGPFPPKAADNEIVRRLRAAGAVIVGKTNTPEVGQWPFTEGLAFGATRNPWNLDHTSGGSSGGSATAVAASLVPAAVGSDGAGSIRIPAAWTHLVGIKPQRGRISTAPDAELFNGLTVYGPLARSVADAALLLDVLAGTTSRDRHRPRPADGTYLAAARRPPGRLRIALSFKIPFSGMPAKLDPVVGMAVRRLADVLTGLGHEVIEADPPYGLMGLWFLPRSLAGVDAWRRGVPDESLLDPRTLANARTGRWLRPLLPAARLAEHLERLTIGSIFRKADVVLAPTTALPPPRVGAMNRPSNARTDREIVAACPYTWPWNVLGWPSINVPAGFTDGGLPIGAQLMGRANSERLLISLAAQLEAVERWPDARPRAGHVGLAVLGDGGF